MIYQGSYLYYILLFFSDQITVKILEKNDFVCSFWHFCVIHSFTFFHNGPLIQMTQGQEVEFHEIEIGGRMISRS
jgi:hypothetical protein